MCSSGTFGCGVSFRYLTWVTWLSLGLDPVASLNALGPDMEPASKGDIITQNFVMKYVVTNHDKARNESHDNREDGNTSISSSTVTVNKSLPWEIVLDILYRLPILCLPKDLIRTIKDLIKSSARDEFEHTRFHILATNSKFVRHHWEQSLTTNPRVIALSPEKTRFYFAEDYTSYDTAVEIDLAHEPKLYSVSGICNGLVCLTEQYSYLPSDVYLWNPLTTEQLRIEVPGNVNFPTWPPYEVLFGFGCLQGATDYKLLRLLYQNVSSGRTVGSHASMYSLSTKSWRDLPKVPRFGDLIVSDPPAMVNESLHWLAVVGDYCDRILSFNIKEETFEVFQIPFSCKHGGVFSPSLLVMELGGQLCVYDNPIDGELQVWVMKAYGVSESWTSLFKIGGLFTQLRPLGVTNDGEIILKKNTQVFNN